MFKTVNTFSLFKKSGSSLFAKCLYSSSAKLVNIEVNDKTGIALLTLNRPPVNSLSLELLTDINNGFDEIQNNKCKGMIITSSSNTVYSAGLDLTEMYKFQEDRARSFWRALQEVWMKLYTYPIPTAAAINGHAPAGGCLIAASCEYRVMSPKFTIGLNETQLGIVAPSWFISVYHNTLSRRDAERALMVGKLFTTDEALKVGLIDDVGSDKADCIAKCETFINEFKRIPRAARMMTKHQLRNEDVQKLSDNMDSDVDMFISLISLPKTQETLGAYFASLKKK